MIRIITDSSCDLTDELAARHGIAIVPLTIRFGTEEFVDRQDLSVDDFWARLADGTVTPETAAPPVGRFLEELQQAADAGAEGALIVTLSAAISGTHGAAVLAARDAPLPTTVVDSRVVSGALGLVSIEAAEAAARGLGLDEVAEITQAACDDARLFAALDTLEFLRRGGRIGAAAAFFGSMLNVKPLIEFVDGAVAAAGRVRTARRARDAVVDRARELADVRRLGVIGTDADPDAEFAASIEEATGHPPLRLRIGPVVGTHAGPGVTGIVWVGESTR